MSSVEHFDDKKKRKNVPKYLFVDLYILKYFPRLFFINTFCIGDSSEVTAEIIY